MQNLNTPLELQNTLNSLEGPIFHNFPHEDVVVWLDGIRGLCEANGIRPNQWAWAGMHFLSHELKVAMAAAAEGDYEIQQQIIDWSVFSNIMRVTYGRARGQDTGPNNPSDEDLRKIMKGVGIACAAAGGLIILPAVGIGLLTAVGFTSGGIAAGSLAATIQSIVYGGATGGLFSVLQGLGATAVMPAIGAQVAGGGLLASAAGLLGFGRRRV